MDTVISGNEYVINTVKSLYGKADSQAVLKPSRFNYYQPSRSGFLVYNTLYNTLLRITKAEYEKITGQRRIGRDLAKKLYREGILIEQDLDEYEIYVNYAEERRKQDKPFLSVNIAATLKCNARCFYCYEHGVRHDDFSKTQQNQLIKFIKSVIRENDKLLLNWFGGEPLLGRQVLDFVSEKLKKANIDFSSYLITNGSLITKQTVAEDFPRWNVQDVQITLDGAAATYAKRKAYTDQKRGVFNRILKNIAMTAKAGIKVHVRLNIDRRNREEILEVLKLLEERFGDAEYVTWYPAFLTGVGDDLSAQEKIDFLSRMFAVLKNPTKMNAAGRLYSFPRISACMRNDSRSFSVDVYGNIYNCERLVGRKSEAIGKLSSFDMKANLERCSAKLPDECTNCVFLPKCLGGCAANLATGDELCMIEKYIIMGYLVHLSAI